MSHNLLLEEVGPGEELPGFDIDDPILPRVERVLGFCTEAEAVKFLEETPLFEAGLVRDGIILIKLWLTVGREMQLNASMLGAIIH